MYSKLFIAHKALKAEYICVTYLCDFLTGFILLITAHLDLLIHKKKTVSATIIRKKL